MPIWQPILNDPAGNPIEVSPSTLLDASRAHHRNTFGVEPTGAATAPATWSLIGEHTDHSGGVVLSSIAQWSVAVSVSPNQDSAIMVQTVSQGKKNAEQHSISVEEVAVRATAQQASVDANGRPSPAPSPEGGIAARLGGVAWTMVHRQMLSRDTRGLNITVVTSIPEGLGLGEAAAYDVATALALCNEGTDDAPVRARLADICSQAAYMFGEAAPLRARHTAALRGENAKMAVIDYADGSVTQAPHPVSKSAGLSAIAVLAPTDDALPADSTEHRRRQSFIDEATRAFSVESLRLLPDAPIRVIEWLQAVLDVTGRTDLPNVEEARNWLNFWEQETVRAQRLSSALRSRRRNDIAELLAESQRDLTEIYGIPATESAVAQLCLARGALSARSASAGIAHGVITLIDAPKAPNFIADLAEDGFLVVPLGHGEIAATAD